MIVCIDCFKPFQTISNKNKTCNGPGSQSESENRTWHHAQTSRKKKCILHTFWKDNKTWQKMQKFHRHITIKLWQNIAKERKKTGSLYWIWKSLFSTLTLLHNCRKCRNLNKILQYYIPTKYSQEKTDSLYWI